MYIYIYIYIHNSVALVRERTIPTERPPPVGEVGAIYMRQFSIGNINTGRHIMANIYLARTPRWSNVALTGTIYIYHWVLFIASLRSWQIFIGLLRS